ncbi:hypothetical protein [uncultured Kriegella sp.]|uniref:hypothetical protein n=1 Tax=uncultured Kriegella sp. TaxID=1798910 RepID=UPI0030DCE371
MSQMTKTSLLQISTVLILCSFSKSSKDEGSYVKDNSESNAVTDKAILGAQINKFNGDSNAIEFTVQEASPLMTC